MSSVQIDTKYFIHYIANVKKRKLSKLSYICNIHELAIQDINVVVSDDNHLS
jgi:hypothetical protein